MLRKIVSRLRHYQKNHEDSRQPPPPNRGFGGFYGLDFRQFSFNDVLKKIWDTWMWSWRGKKNSWSYKILYLQDILHRKKSFLFFFDINPEAVIQRFEVLSKEAHPQIKKNRIFFTNSISASSRWILMTTIWKSIYLNRSKRL